MLQNDISLSSRNVGALERRSLKSSTHGAGGKDSILGTLQNAVCLSNAYFPQLQASYW